MEPNRKARDLFPTLFPHHLTMSNSIKYRPDIDGLRAVAVICVILFHFNPEFLIGGYLGVDIFFVISGYLITRLISKAFEQKEFSILSFWKRRINRLMPSMLLMLSITLLTAIILLFGSERLTLSNNAVAAFTSWSNIYLWRVTDSYWAENAASMPLLHTWSLSVEEQFYLIFPFALILLYKLKNRLALVSVLFITMLASYWLDRVYGGYSASAKENSIASFYFLHTRLWELLLGSLVSFLPPFQHTNKSWSRIFGLTGPIIGLVFIGISVVVIGKNDIDRIDTALACIGSGLLIYFGGQDFLSRFLLSNRLMTYIGKLSYSLYLWHWPVIVFSGYLILKPTWQEYFLISLLIITLSLIAHYLIEKPMRYKPSRMNWVCLSSLFAVSLSCAYLVPSDLVTPEKLQKIYAEESYHMSHEFNARTAIESDNDGIHVGDLEAPVKFVLLGSSHAWVYAEAFKEDMESRSLHGLVLTLPDVGITVSPRCSTKPSQQDITNNETRIQVVVQSKPQCTIIGGLWLIERKNPDFKRNFKKQVEKIAGASGEVVVLGQPPMFLDKGRGPSSLRRFIRVTGRGHAYEHFDVLEDVRIANNELKDLCGSFSNVTFVDTYKYLTDHSRFVPYNQGKFLYRDKHHLNGNGGSFIYTKQIRPLL